MGFKTYTTVSKWESDENSPKGKDIKRLAELFNVTSDYLLCIDDTSSQNIIADKDTDSLNREIDKLVKDRELNKWLYEMIDNNPDDLIRLKQMWEVMNSSNENKKT
ncbi:XRE family transcriptional regulator [Paenilisteria newyorkensis]|nr:XRE family transcriptional regulator [Listeria newyorkensis]